MSTAQIPGGAEQYEAIMEEICGTLRGALAQAEQLRGMEPFRYGGGDTGIAAMEMDALAARLELLGSLGAELRMLKGMLGQTGLGGRPAAPLYQAPPFKA